MQVAPKVSMVDGRIVIDDASLVINNAADPSGDLSEVILDQVPRPTSLGTPPYLSRYLAYLQPTRFERGSPSHSGAEPPKGER
eukprot:2797988-Rhodomonas_salina.1